MYAEYIPADVPDVQLKVQKVVNRVEEFGFAQALEVVYECIHRLSLSCPSATCMHL